MAETRSILDYVKNPEILNYARALTPNQFFGFQLFPIQHVPELDYRYIKGQSGVKQAMIADVVGWESPAPMAPHEGLERVEGELPPIKQKSRFSEQEVVKIFDPRTSAEREYVITKLFNDVQDRVDAIYARGNQMIMDALGTGKTTLSSNGVKVEIDWDVPDAQVDNANVMWGTTATSDPVKDFTDMRDVIKDAQGVTVDRAVTSTKAIALLLQSEKLRKQVFGADLSDRLLTLNQVNAFFAGIGLPTLYAYDEKYRIINRDGTFTATRYFPEKVCTLFSTETKLGDFLMGPTAEAVRSIGTQVKPGIWAEVYETKDPVNVWTYACATAFPTFPGCDQIGILTVLS